MPRKKSRKYGLIIKPIEQGNYLGGVFSSLPKEVLQEDGQWDNWLPLTESQALSVETQACTVFGTLSAVEMLVDRRYGKEKNWSDRWLAWNSDITPQGQDPHHTCETLRKGGTPLQERWDYTEEINTWDKFYETPPPKLFDYAIEDFKDRYEFLHEYVNTDMTSLKEALKLSPLGIGVTAWYEDGRSGIYSDKGRPNNHWCVLFGYDDNMKAWKVFDSYDGYIKLYSYDSRISVAKRFWVKEREKRSWWEWLWKKWSKLWEKLIPYDNNK